MSAFCSQASHDADSAECLFNNLLSKLVQADGRILILELVDRDSDLFAICWLGWSQPQRL